MIKPTVGRVVHFYQEWAGGLPQIQGQPLAAIVTGVWSDTCVNLCVFDANGGTHGMTSVPLVQEGNPKPDYFYCEWMPYQVGQAAKTEALEKQLADKNKITKEQMAGLIGTVEYPASSNLTKDILANAKAAGLIIVYGQSDDLMKFDGAFRGEVGAYNGTTAFIDALGVLDRGLIDDGDDDEITDFVNRKRKARTIEALWAKEDGYSWTFKTDIPHATFEIVEDGAPYCRALVIDLADLASN